MEPNSEIDTRITASADKLYQASGNQKYPTVDQVRRAASCSMNDASRVMKEWRRQQTAIMTPAAVTIPERINTTMNQALAMLWTEAQTLANESLNMAQQAWETERDDAEVLRTELAQAFEAQVEEIKADRDTIKALRAELTLAQDRVTKAEHTAEQASTARKEIEQRANDYQARIKELKVELTDAQKVRETVAGLEGKLETLQIQNTELLTVLKSQSSGGKDKQ